MKDFPKEEFESRWQRARALMDEQHLDAILVTERTNYRYFSGNRTIQHNNKQRPMIVLVPRKGRPVMMVYGLEAQLCRDETWIEDIRTYVDVPFPAKLVVDTLKDLGLDNGRIGCELGDNQRLWMTYQEFDDIRAGLPNAKFVDGSQVYVQCRLVKSPLEVARIEQACRITEVAWEIIRRRVHPGMTVPIAERVCMQALVDAGSDPVTPGFILLDVLGYGPDFVYKKGDLFFCDIGGSFNGYKSDFARMATFGPPSDSMKRNHERIYRIFNAVVGSMNAGSRCRDVAAVFNREAEALGYPKLQGTKRIGHGCGLEHQEAASLNIVDETVLVPGMVFTPEPRFVQDGQFIMVEEDVVVTDKGARLLSTGCERLYQIDA